MKNLELKVCGMRDRTNILEVAVLEPDYMGFIFYPGSKRFVGNDFTVPAELPASIRRVGVFVNQPVEQILHVVISNRLDFVQLHGNESAGACREIRQSGVGVIKGFTIGPSFDFHNVRLFVDVADYFLFDAKGDHFGGNGVTFDWSRLNQYDQRVPFFLSGGISPGNISDVTNLRAPHLHAIDVNSRVESEIGIKDVSLIEKIQRLMINEIENI